MFFRAFERSRDVPGGERLLTGGVAAAGIAPAGQFDGPISRYGGTGIILVLPEQSQLR